MVFASGLLHFLLWLPGNNRGVAKLVKASGSQPENRGFESRHLHQK